MTGHGMACTMQYSPTSLCIFPTCHQRCLRRFCWFVCWCRCVYQVKLSVVPAVYSWIQGSIWTRYCYTHVGKHIFAWKGGKRERERKEAFCGFILNMCAHSHAFYSRVESIVCVFYSPTKARMCIHVCVHVYVHKSYAVKNCWQTFEFSFLCNTAKRRREKKAYDGIRFYQRCCYCCCLPQFCPSQSREKSPCLTNMHQREEKPFFVRERKCFSFLLWSSVEKDETFHFELKTFLHTFGGKNHHRCTDTQQQGIRKSRKTLGVI